MNTAAKGRRNEHKSRRLLEAAGYEVIRAGASKGVWDLWGISSTDVILCQVKSNRNPCSAEMETMRMFPCPPFVRRILHVWKDRARSPIVKVIE